MEKKKVLVLSDHPLSPSGVGSQTKYMIEALLKTGQLSASCALVERLKHAMIIRLQKVDPWGDDWHHRILLMVMAIMK